MYHVVIPGELPDLNTVINASKGHWGGYSKEKAQWTRHVALLCSTLPQLESCALAFKWFVRNRRKDPDNIVFAKKYVLDGMVEAGVIQNDGWKEVVSFKDEWEVDADNPRVEVSIWEAGA